MKQQHHPKDGKTYIKGANRDAEKEYLNTDEGSYVDACNMRPVNMDGDIGSLAKIKGETLKYGAYDTSCNVTTFTPLSDSYQCIGTCEVQQQIVEFWVDENSIDPPIIRVDGKIVAKSYDLPFLVTHPLQIAVNESCVGGEVYVTDYNTAPTFWNVSDLVANSGTGANCTSKYFEDFNPLEQQIQPKGTINTPKFVKLTSSSSSPRKTNGTGGLPAGSYSYAIRYLDSTGNPTNIGMFTPTIPVIPSYRADSDEYPWSATYGQTADETDLTTFGIELRIKVDNSNNYDQLEVIRTRWTSATGLGTPPTGEIIMKIQLNDEEVTSFKVFDNSLDKLETVTDEVKSVQLTSLARAKAIRYFENKLYLANIEYDSVDMSGQVNVPTNPVAASTIYPVAEFMGKVGHKSPYNHTYYKSYMSDEEYGFAVVGFDEKGTRSFAEPIPGAESVKMARRRDVASQASRDLSPKGMPDAATNDGSQNYCHEVFDLIPNHPGAFPLPERKDDVCKFINMVNAGHKCWRNAGSVGDGQKQLFVNCTNAINSPGYEAAGAFTCLGAAGTNFGAEIDAKELGFFGLRPYVPTDNYSDHGYLMAEQMYRGAYGAGEINMLNQSPRMYAPNYYAKGFALDSISVPKWVKSFSIVRTLAAQRVAAQGLAFYALDQAASTSTATAKAEANYLKNQTRKKKNTIWFYAPDADSDIGLSPLLFNDIQNSQGSGEFVLKVESPLGFGTEYYNWNDGVNNTASSWTVDMISYVRLAKDYTGLFSMEFNPGEFGHMGIAGVGAGSTGTFTTFRYPTFGRWRSAKTTEIVSNFSGNTNTKTFKITGISLVKGAGTYAGKRGAEYWEITLDKPIYQHGKSGLSSTNTTTFNEPETQDFHEPAYIASIVREANKVDPNPQIQQYIPIGHIQHEESLIYSSEDDNKDFTYHLVDERWEDCIPDLVDHVGGGTIQNSRISQSRDFWKVDRYVTVKDENGNPTKWVNLMNKTVATTNSILAGLQANGSIDVLDAAGNIEKGVTGVYNSGDINNEQFSLIFGSTGFKSGVNLGGIDKQYYIPKKGWTVYIKYDRRIPIRFFGGDSFIGENLSCIVDAEYGGAKGKPLTGSDTFVMSVGMPYHKVDQNARTFFVKNAIKKSKDNIQTSRSLLHEDNSNQGLQPSRIRQWLLMFTAETRLCSPYYFSDLSNKSTLRAFFPSTHYRQRPHEWDAGDPKKLIHPEYFTAYGDEEIDQWGYGGFRFRPLHNIDYCQYNNFQDLLSKPKVGYNDETLYCTRVIWSEENALNITDSPNVRTFKATSAYDVSDDTGAIKHMWDDDDSKGNNLYAFTDEGVVSLMTDKRIISQLNGGQLAAVESPERGVQKQIWINKKIGMNDEMWRTAAESSGRIYWANRNSVYVLDKGTIMDIGRVKYHEKIYKQFLQNVGVGYTTPITGTYNTLHREYWLTLSDESNNKKIPAGNKSTINYTAPTAGFVGQMRWFNYNGNKTVDNGNLGINASAYYLLNNQTTDLDRFEIGSTMITNGNITLTSDSNPVTILDTITGTSYTLEADKSYLITPLREDSADIVGFTVEEVANLFKGQKEQVCTTLMWSEVNKQWIGTNAHDFDRFLSFDNLMYGMRDALTYELNKGDSIYNAPVDAYVINVSSGTASRKSASANLRGDGFDDKEFIRFRLASNVKPDLIHFYETEAQMDADTPVCTLTENELKDYHGFEQYIPRKTLTDNKRLQGRIMFFRIEHKKAEDFKVVSSEVQYKTLK